jgi:hypothetical protein
MQQITVHLIKPRKQRTVVYEGVVLVQEPGHVLVHARWERRAMDLGYVVFAPETISMSTTTASVGITSSKCGVPRASSRDGTAISPAPPVLKPSW